MLSGIKAFLAILFVSLMVLPYLSVAQEEYTTDYQWIDAGVMRDQTAQHSPKVACDTNDPDVCVVLYYFSGDTFDPTPSLVVKWTFDGFETPISSWSYSKVPETVDYETSGIQQNVSANYTEYGLPFGITYFGDTFWIVFDSGSGGDNYAYMFSPYNQTWTGVWGKSYSMSIIDIVDKDTDFPLVFYLRHSGTTTKHGTVGFFYLVNGTILYQSNTLFDFDCGTTGFNYLDARGFVAKNGDEWAYDIDARIKCGAYDSWHIDASFPRVNMTFTEPHNAIWYYDGVRMFYKDSNFTTLEGQVYYSPTDDFATFGDKVLYYNFNLSGNEFLNYTSIDSIAEGQFTYVYKSDKDATEGIYASKQTYYQLRIVYPSVIDMDDFTTEYVNVTAILNCNDYDYQVMETGHFIDLYTPCANNTLTLVPESGMYPQTELMNVEFTESCNMKALTVHNQYRKPYDFIVRVTDALTGERVSGATVNVDGTINTTNANGEAIIHDFFPVIDSTFMVSEIGCVYDLIFDGTPKLVSVIGSKSGYSTYSTTEYFATEPLGDPLIDFDRDFSFKMASPSTQLNIRAFTQDAIELDVETGSINVYGANKTYLFEYGNYFEQSFSDTLPSLFVLTDSRNNYSVNVTLVYCNEYYQQNITVTEGAYQEAIFDLNIQSTALCCETNLDCPVSFCEDRYWKRADGCSLHQCQYTTIVCDSVDLCDDERGCFDAQGTQSCEIDEDCLNHSTCLTDYKSRVGLCGSENKCIFKDMICDYCNATTGLCEESSLCLELGRIRHRFLIQATTQLWVEGNYVTYQDVDYYCGLDNRGERRCIDGAIVPKMGVNPVTQLEQLVGITTLPDAWAYTTNASNYIFHDISVICDDLCNITYNYCEYGCNAETGYCHISPMSPEGQVSIYTDMVVDWWYLIFPTSAAQSIAYIFIALFVSATLTYYIGKNGSGNNGLVFLGATIAVVLGGVPLGTIPFFVGVIYAVIAGYLVLKMWKGT